MWKNECRNKGGERALRSFFDIMVTKEVKSTYPTPAGSASDIILFKASALVGKPIHGKRKRESPYEAQEEARSEPNKMAKKRGDEK